MFNSHKHIPRLVIGVFLASVCLTSGTIVPPAFAQSTQAKDCRIIVTSGPKVNADGSYTYTFSATGFSDNTNTCYWEINGDAQDGATCTPFSKTFPSSQKGNRIIPHLKVLDKDKNVVCQTNDATNLFSVGESRAVIARQLEVQYPILRDGSTISLRTTPASLIHYAFILALSVMGIVAFASLLFAGLELMTGAADKARQRALGTLVGIVILLGSYLLLTYINPELIRLKDPQLQQINISVPQNFINIMNECKQLGSSATCSVYNSDWHQCVDNTCSSISPSLASDNCTFGGHDCYSVKQACQNVKTCGDYYDVTGIHGNSSDPDRRNACEFNVCHLSKKCFVVDTGTVLSGQSLCLNAEEKQSFEQGQASSDTAAKCVAGAITRCEDYPLNACSVDYCSTVAGAKGVGPCVAVNGHCLNKALFCAGITKCSDYDAVYNISGGLTNLCTTNDICGLNHCTMSFVGSPSCVDR